MSRLSRWSTPSAPRCAMLGWTLPQALSRCDLGYPRAPDVEGPRPDRTQLLLRFGHDLDGRHGPCSGSPQRGLARICPTASLGPSWQPRHRASASLDRRSTIRSRFPTSPDGPPGSPRPDHLLAGPDHGGRRWRDNPGRPSNASPEAPRRHRYRPQAGRRADPERYGATGPGSSTTTPRTPRRKTLPGYGMATTARTARRLPSVESLLSGGIAPSGSVLRSLLANRGLPLKATLVSADVSPPLRRVTVRACPVVMALQLERRAAHRLHRDFGTGWCSRARRRVRGRPHARLRAWTTAPSTGSR